MPEAYRRQRIRTALVRAGHLVLGQPAGPFGGGGRSDLIVCVRPFGVFGAVEVKDRGEKPTRAQFAFGAQVIRSGGFWIWGSEPEEVLRNLEREVAQILHRRAQSIAEPGGAKSTMPIDIDDLFTNPPPPLTPAQLAELVDETEPVTDVPVSVDVTVTEVVINGTRVDPQLPEAAAKVMGYESAEAREKIDPPPARKRASRAKPKPTPAEESIAMQEAATADQNAFDLANGTATREEKIAELDARDAKLNGTSEGVLDAIEEIGDSTPFDELRVLKDEYERALEEVASATAHLNSAVQALLQLSVREV